MKIKEIPASEQPRELLKTYGVENLSNSDLLSIILRTGVKDINVREVSLNILKEVGSINNLDNMGVRELSKIKGKTVILFGFALSLFIELFQLFLPRWTDIDDIILNTFGTLIGYLLYKYCVKIYNREW